MGQQRDRGIYFTVQGIDLIEDAMQLKGCDRKQLAEQIGVEYDTVCRYLRRKQPPQKDSIRKIANHLGLKPRDIVNPDEWNRSSESPETKSSIVDWRSVSERMLENLKKLTTESLTAGDGIRFEFDNIFVPLGVVERQEKSKRKQEDGSPDRGSELYAEKVTPISHNVFFEDVLLHGNTKISQGKRIAIIGEAGAGKTTQLQKIGSWLLEETDYIPVWISLTALGAKSLREYLLEDWVRDASEEMAAPQAWKDSLGEAIKSGKVWLLLDGVDEMTVSNPLSHLSSQLREGWLKDVRIVITCRVNVWDAGKNALTDFDVYRNLDFDYPNDVYQFIGNWFASAPDLADKLKQALEQSGKERIRDMVKNPLRLTLLCYSWQKQQGELPETKAGLYDWFVDAFYEWNKGKTKLELTRSKRNELNQALGELAKLAIDSEDSRFRLTETFIENVMNPDLFELALELNWLNEVGIASENSLEKVYAFYHPSFQEYFAALAINDWDFFLPKDHVDAPLQNDVGKYKRYRILESIWQETLILWIGRNSILETQKVNFISKINSFKDNCMDLYYYQLYFISVQLYSEIKNIKSLDNQFEEIIDQIITWKFGEYDPQNFLWNNKIDLFYKKCGELLFNINSTKIIDILMLRLNITREKILDYFNFNYQEYEKKKESIITSRRDLLEDDTVRIYDSLPYQIIDIIRNIKHLSTDNSLIANIAIDIFFNQKYPYDRCIFCEMCPETIHDVKIVESIIKILPFKKNEYIITKDSCYLDEINFLIYCLGGSEVFKDEIVNELTSIVKDPKYIYFHLSAAENILRIDPNNQFAIFEIIKPLMSLDSEDNDILANISPVLEKFAVGNTQVIELLSQVILDKPINTNASFFAIDCLGRIVNNDGKIIDLLINSLKKANNLEAYVLKIEDQDKYQEEIEDLNEVVDNICSNLIDIVNIMSINYNIVEELISLLMSFSHVVNRLYICEYIESIAPNNSIVSDEIEAILGLGEHIFSFIEYHRYRFKNLGKNQRLIELLLKFITNFPDTIEKIKFVKLLAIFDSHIAVDYLSKVAFSSRYIAYTEILSSIDLNNKLSIRKLFQEFLNREIEDNDNLKDYRESILRHLISTLKDCNDMKQMVTVISSQKLKICNIELSDSRKDARLQSNLYALLWHCAQNMSYPDFYEAWHSQPSIHPEMADITPSNSRNKIQILESQLIDFNAVQKELDRTNDRPEEVCCIVVDIRQLEQESDPNAIAEEIGIRIFDTLGLEIPEIQRVSNLKRELTNLKHKLGVKKIAIALYGKSANEAIEQLCQSLAPIQTRLFTGGQSTQELITKINAWLSEM